ncbi:MAG: DUF4079 family protein [bacterium]|nr:DUF4079 family protein [bacterium]
MIWLAYAHPIAMLAVLVLGLWVLREGLRIRRAGLTHRKVDSGRHARRARLFAALLILGCAAGLASQAWLREKPVLESVHSWLVGGTLLAISITATLGLRLEGQPEKRGFRTVHALLGSLGMLLALAAAVAGWSILP